MALKHLPAFSKVLHSSSTIYKSSQPSVVYVLGVGMCQRQQLAEEMLPKGSRHWFTGVGLSMVAASCELPQEFLPSTSWDLGVATS